jgi:capsule polysaccharide modification protein KpsS
MNDWIEEESCGIYLSNAAYQDYLNYPWEAEIFEKHMREQAMEFLSNGKLKLLRSAGEGNMIVHLSNITFTPNKTLGDKVYDFSATVTEAHKLSKENLKKYNFNVYPANMYEYTLSVVDVSAIDGDCYSAVINANQLINGSLILQAKEVGYYE